MKKILAVMWKEIRDNLRDQRSLGMVIFFAIMMPAMMFGPIIFVGSKNIQSYDKPSVIHVYGQDRAPNLINHLYSENIDTKPAPEDFEAQLKNGEIDVVLEISETYPERFASGLTAMVTLHYDGEDIKSQGRYRKVRGVLYEYSTSIAASRMMIRGLDHQLLRPVNTVVNDLSEEDKVAGNIANMLMFLVIFSMLSGGFYLAVDSTAGERERNSLEPLLALSVTRFQIVSGKYLAIFSFVALSYLIPIIASAIWISFIPESIFGFADIPNAPTFLKIALLAFPICLLVTGLLMLFSAATKSPKEAQTQMGIVTFIPMAPFFAMMFMDIKLTSVTGAVPILGQYLIANKVLVDSTFPLLSMIPGLVSTLAVSAAFFLIVVYLYRRDSILG